MNMSARKQKPKSVHAAAGNGKAGVNGSGSLSTFIYNTGPEKSAVLDGTPFRTLFWYDSKDGPTRNFAWPETRRPGPKSAPRNRQRGKAARKTRRSRKKPQMNADKRR